MPKVFLVRKRQHWKAASCGIVTPPPSPEQAMIVPPTSTTTATTTTTNKAPPKPEQTHHQSLAELHPRARWTETWQKQRTRVEGGRGEAETTPPISPCTLPVSPCNPPSPVLNLERFRPNHENIVHTRDEVAVEEPTSSCSTPPLHSQPAYMAVPVIQSPSVQDRPLDYHVPRRQEYTDNEQEETLINLSRARLVKHEKEYQPVQQHTLHSNVQIPDSQDDSHSDIYSYDMRPVSPGDSDSNSSRSPDSLVDDRGEKMAMIPSLPVRLTLLQQRLGLPTDVPLEFVNGGHGIKNPLLQRSYRNSSPAQDMSPLPSPGNEILPGVGEGEAGRLSCRVCGKTFGLQRLLNRHMKCHSDMKRYLCTFCGKGFNDTFDLKRHTRTHTGVRPYKCNMCEKSFTQRCSLESHTLKVHGIQHQYAYKERRAKVYVCEECGHTTTEPEVHYVHLKQNHPYSPALLKFYDKRHFKFSDGSFPLGLLRVPS
ncbi:zinc finger protein 200-like isoform X2 [Argiope bruennichi]|uniref:Transcriptional regulator ovo like protein n=2 Tax=Argiope bruennichi TaxID=94029 RepID=A0A8T0FNI4_ARGBR|nr:zinc finger protein 200-like isoform X2 [Argiope bruennichi]KAF8790980.1 Transcriptional regulator ovo like protein [Argiope bruennichi]